MSYVGSVVRSLSGRDKKRLFVIVGVLDDGKSVMLSDGRLHPLSSPKKKNLRHVAILAVASGDETSALRENDSLYEYLKVFEENLNASIKS